MSVVLNTEEFIPTQREDIRKETDKILDDFMEPLVNMTIIAEIKSIAMAANVPQGFIDGVKFRKTGPNQGEVINTWGTTEKPLAIWFNYGTTQHWIAPVTAKALAWKGSEGKHATAIFFQGESKKGDTLFSTGHYVSGVPRTEAMEIGFNTGKKRMAEEAGKIIERELQHE
jgi:hypothetical protein